MTKPTKSHVSPAKAQIRPSLCALRIAKDPRYLHADSEDSGQICVFAGRTGHFVGFVMLWFKSASISHYCKLPAIK